MNRCITIYLQSLLAQLKYWKICYERKKKNEEKTQCYYKRLINKKEILFVVTFLYPRQVFLASRKLR